MNENLDLVKILKDCPKGTKLYSTMYGDVTFDGIVGGNYWPIRTYADCTLVCFRINGHYSEPDKGECVLFPSEDNRDWSTFKAPKKHKMFKPYDKVLVRVYSKDRWEVTLYSYFIEGKDVHHIISGYNVEDANIIPYEGNEDKVGKVTD